MTPERSPACPGITRRSFLADTGMGHASGKRLGEVVSQLARRGLRTTTEAGSRSGLPVFKVATDAAVIPGNRASDLLADDAP